MPFIIFQCLLLLMKLFSMKVSYGELVLLGELFVNYFFKKNYK